MATRHQSPIIESKSSRSRIVAALLAIFFGNLGLHKFYLGKAGWGLAYLFFSWTFIPWIIAFFEGVRYLLMSDKEFENLFT